MLYAFHVPSYRGAAITLLRSVAKHDQIKQRSALGFVRSLTSVPGGQSEQTRADMSATSGNVSRSVSPLVTTEWLHARVSAPPPNLRVLDGSWHLPISKRSALREYRQSHIPGALFFDIDECSDKSSEHEHMLPPAEVFENYVSRLGINNQTHVVVYDNNATFGLFSAQRVWWMFRAFGHNLVSVLDGGFPKWISENRDTTDEIDKITNPADFRFRATFNPASVKTYEQVESNVPAPGFTLMDARPAGRFEGTAPEPRPGKCLWYNFVRFPSGDCVKTELHVIRKGQ